MIENNNLVSAYAGAERERVTTHLKRLLPYLRPHGFTIVGGLAIRYHLLSYGVSYPKRPFNDLDIIAKDPDVVSRSVSKDFLVYHYHPKDHYLALVDPISRTKVDIFNRAPHETIKVLFDNKEVDMASLEDQLVQTVIDTLKVTQDLKVDPKQFSDAEFMLKAADIDKAKGIWRQFAPKDYPKDLVEAFELAKRISKKKPYLLKENPFRKDKPYECPECRSTNGFEIVPMEKVYKVLGIVE